MKPKVKRYKIEKALDWQLYKKSLRWELTDCAERDLKVGEKEGVIEVTVVGDSFVCTFWPAK